MKRGKYDKPIGKAHVPEWTQKDVRRYRSIAIAKGVPERTYYYRIDAGYAPWDAATAGDRRRVKSRDRLVAETEGLYYKSISRYRRRNPHAADWPAERIAKEILKNKR